MSNTLVENQKNKLKLILGSDDVKRQMKAALKEKAPQFAVSLMNLFQTDLVQCDPQKVVGCAMIAATLDLPIDKNLGFAYIVPYKNKGENIPQFQMGYKGYIQLAQRTGQYRKINVTPIYKENFISWNPLMEDLMLNFEKEPDYKNQPVGYAAYFETITGFKKTVYWTYEKVKTHAETYSQSYKAFINKKVYSSIWNDNFDSMAMKTVVKDMLKRWGILSVELQKAIETDQSSGDGKHPDNEKPEPKKSALETSFECQNIEEAEITNEETGEILEFSQELKDLLKLGELKNVDILREAKENFNKKLEELNSSEIKFLIKEVQGL